MSFGKPINSAPAQPETKSRSYSLKSYFRKGNNINKTNNNNINNNFKVIPIVSTTRTARSQSTIDETIPRETSRNSSANSSPRMRSRTVCAEDSTAYAHAQQAQGYGNAQAQAQGDVFVSPRSPRSSLPQRMSGVFTLSMRGLRNSGKHKRKSCDFGSEELIWMEDTGTFFQFNIFIIILFHFLLLLFLLFC